MDAGGIGRRAVAAGGAGWLLAGAAGSRALAAAGKPRVAIHTKHALILVELEAEKAPLTCANFLHYVDAGKYDGGQFYRATRTPGAPADGTVVGSPAKGVRPFPPIAHESTTKTGLRHVDGTVSLGRFAPGSATDNFFICVGPQPYLDAHPGAKGDNLGYAAFGRVVQGMDEVRRIHRLPANGASPFADQKGEWLKHPALIVSMRRA